MLFAAGILLALPLQTPPVAQPHYQGRPVVEVIEEIRRGGLGLVYNTALVPETLRVREEPREREPEKLLREILRPHGLALSPVAPNLFAIVAAPAAQRAADAPVGGLRDKAGADEIIVNSSRYVLADAATAGSRTVFTREQIESMPKLGDEALRAVQRLPGAATNGFSGLARVRGGEENESQIVLNGLTLYEPFHLKNFFGPVSLLDSRLLGGIDVYTGGYGVEFGDRMSAVIDMHTLAPTGSRYNELGISAFHTHALASGPLAGGRGDWLAAARRSNLDALSQFSETDYGEPHYADGFARVSYELSPGTRIALNGLGSHDSVLAQTNGQRERSKVDYTNQYAWAELDHAGGRLHSRLLASVTVVDNDRRGQVNDPAGVLGEVADERRFSIFGLHYEGRAQEQDDADWLRSRWGVEFKALQARYRYASAVEFSDAYLLPVLSLPPGTRSLSRNFAFDPRGETYAAWWSSRIRLQSRLTADLGLRWDAQSYTGPGLEHQLSPRLNLLYELNADTELRGSWGRYFQSEGIHELQVEEGVTEFFPAQRADHLIVSLQRRLGPRTQLRVEIYRKDYSRLRPRYENLFDPLVLLPELQSDRVRIAPDAAHVQAMEMLFARRGAGPWNGWLSYTLSRVVDRIDGREIARSWDQRHAVQVGFDRSGRYWDFALAGSWHSGWPITAATVVGSGAAQSVQIGPRNAERLEDFTSIDLRLTRRFALSRGELSAFGELSNAFDHANPCCRRYTAARQTDGSIVLDSRARQWLPIVPSAGVLWRF